MKPAFRFVFDTNIEIENSSTDDSSYKLSYCDCCKVQFMSDDYLYVWCIFRDNAESILFVAVATPQLLGDPTTDDVLFKACVPFQLHTIVRSLTVLDKDHFRPRFALLRLKVVQCICI